MAYKQSKEKKKYVYFLDRNRIPLKTWNKYPKSKKIFYNIFGMKVTKEQKKRYESRVDNDDRAGHYGVIAGATAGAR